MHRVAYDNEEVVLVAGHVQEEAECKIRIILDPVLYMIDWEIARHASHVVVECNLECVVEDYKLIIAIIIITNNNNNKDHAVVADNA